MKPENGKLCQVHGWLPEPLLPAWSPIFCDYISLPCAALKAPFSGFSLFFFSALLAGDDGGEAGEWQGLN